jgi:CubicO group peptidase (beta-lactamase class C family)
MRQTTGVILFCLALSASIARAGESSSPPGRPAAESANDAVDEVIRVEMQKRHVPGLSLAIIQDGQIVKAKGYGVTEKGGDVPVTTSTLFQAGSISKPVSALGALCLVERGKLALDEDVNARLRSWKVPSNEFTGKKTVTLRGLLSHTAGLTVHGFPGYATDEPVPTLVQVLDGAKPANTDPIRVDVAPGSLWRYSGGGYTIMQQMVVDVTGQPFPQLMKETVLVPLGMNESTFEQPLPAERARLTATGHYADRSLVKGKWHIYPEMAAAGLWTTPSDLARFAVGVQAAAAGKSGKTLSRRMAREMLTVQKNTYGLGFGLGRSGAASRFGHGGRDEGFDALLTACAETGQGAAIMINANDNSRMISRIVEVIAREYHWPGGSSETPAKHAAAVVDPDKLDACTGHYEFENNQMMTIATDGGRLVSIVDGFPDEEFLPATDVRFDSAGREIQVTFLKDAGGEVTGLLWKEDGRERKVPRIGPLFRSLKPRTDPDPARTERVVTALKALGQGGKALADSRVLSPGARDEFGKGGPVRDLAGLRSINFLAEQDASGREIERHKGKVRRILHYRLVTDKADRALLVHLTGDGLITDYDIVDD